MRKWPTNIPLARKQGGWEKENLKKGKHPEKSKIGVILPEIIFSDENIY